MATVLVVDDEADIRYLAQVVLELDGHQVRTAGNGAEAVAAIEASVPDVVILDVMMPELDGFSVLEQLKSHFDARIQHTKVIMMTSLGTDDHRLRGTIEGAIRYLVKPVAPDDLNAAVTEVLASGPEVEQRKAAQAGALRELARQGSDGGADADPGPRLSRLERPRARVEDRVASPVPMPVDLGSLTEKQVELLQTLSEAPSVSATAVRLGVSRSNVYASLRRVGRKLGINSVPELLREVRSGRIDIPGS
jgi:DNA-binding NarL/FixJ family response regulator